MVDYYQKYLKYKKKYLEYNTQILNSGGKQYLEHNTRILMSGGDIKDAIEHLNKNIKLLGDFVYDNPPKQLPKTQSIFYMPIISVAYLLYSMGYQWNIQNNKNIIKTIGRITNLKNSNYEIFEMMMRAVMEYIAANDIQANNRYQVEEERLTLLEKEYMRDKLMSDYEGHISADSQEKILSNSIINLKNDQYKQTIQKLIYTFSLLNGMENIDVKSLLDILIYTHYN